MYDYGARFYDPLLGRFISADVVVPIPGNPQDWNRYTYVANNPLRSTDPSGHFIFNRPSWMYFVPGLNVYAYARDCATSISQAVEAYKAGERRVGVLALHATGTTDWLVRQAESVNRLNEDVRVVFSNAPLEERLPHAVHLGIWATGTAATIVGAAQLAKAGIQTLRPESLAGDITAQSVQEGEFSIIDWSGYPSNPQVPRPQGPFRILEGAEYQAARAQANAANAALHQANPALRDMQIHEIQPVKFGGSPIDMANKVFLTPAEHAAFTRWWNALLRALTSRQ